MGSFVFVKGIIDLVHPRLSFLFVLIYLYYKLLKISFGNIAIHLSVAGPLREKVGRSDDSRV